ncbi:MAG TPA: hypothetical protein VHH36_08420, partial [Candidatus Thermoplasmatota archaeon]|nr:hypothetical protein [Candidatus Thermoplasmatota archaeon]
APKDAYFAAYDPWTRRGRVASEEEDPETVRGGLYRAVVKMFDVTIDDRRIQGYNGLADWEEMRDYVFRKLSPDDLDAALAQKRLLIHGGNGAWPRQQIATELLRSDEVGPAALRLAYGARGVPAGEATDDDAVARLAEVEATAKRLGSKGAIAWSSKVLHAMAPARWAPLTPRATPEVGEEIGVPIPEVREPRDYLAFCAAMREIRAREKHPDLGRTDMLVSDTWESLQD